jgi:selenocysteine-specific elongation factor
VLRTDTTVGGGVVLDPAPPRTRDDGRLAVLEDGDPRSIVAAAVDRPVRRSELAGRALLPPEQLQEGVAAVVEAGDWLLPPAWLEEVRASVAERLAARAEGEPLDPGLPLAALLPAEPWAPAVQTLLDVERRGAKAYAPGVTAALGARADAAEALERAVAAAGTSTVRVDDAQLAAFLESQGRLVRVGDGFAVSSELYEAARAAVVQECTRHGSITLARLRDLVGTGRRDAQLLLERLDADGLTRRVGDTRVLRRRGPAAARSS